MHTLFNIYKKSVLIIIIVIFFACIWLGFNYKSNINIYKISETEDGLAVLDVSNNFLNNDKKSLKNKVIQFQVDNKTLRGTIKSVNQVGELVKISGTINNLEGEFRFATENGQITGSIFLADDVYIITQANAETVIKKIELQEPQVVSVDHKGSSEVDTEDPEDNVNNSSTVPQSEENNIGSNNNEQVDDDTETQAPIISPSQNVDQKDSEDRKILQTIKAAETAISASNNDKFSISKYPNNIDKEIEKLDKKKEANQTYVYIPELTPEKLAETSLLDIDTQLSEAMTLDISSKKIDLEGVENTFFIKGTNATSESYLTVNEDGVFGEIILNNTSYTIKPEGISQVHVITPTEAVDETNFLETDEIYPDEILQSSQDQPRELTEEELSNIESELSTTSDPVAQDSSPGYTMPDLPEDEGLDILVMYTPRAQELLGDANILAYSYGNLDVLNTAFTNNNIKARADIVGIELLPDFDVDVTSPYGNPILMAYREESYAQSKREESRADLVILISAPMYDACGVAFIAGTSVVADKAYAVVSGATGCLSTSYKSFVHELGHLMGLRHDRANSHTYEHIFSFNFGYTDKRSFASIMSYTTTCTAPCPRINYFSDPNRFFNGKAIGTESDNNSKALKYTIYDVSNFLNSKNNYPIITGEDYYENVITGFSNQAISSPKINTNINYTKNINVKWLQFPHTNPDTSITKPKAFMVWIHDAKFEYEYRELFEASSICVDSFPQNMLCDIGEIELPAYGDHKLIILPLDIDGKNVSWYNPLYKEVLFTLSDKLPIAEFHAQGSTEGYNQLSVQFINDSQYGQSYEWDFDNNGTIDSTSMNPSYVFGRGLHTVKLIAKNGNGEDSETKIGYINVKAPVVDGKLLGRNIEVADFRETTVYAKRNGTFEFKVEDKSLGTNTNSWSWDLNNDGTIESTDAIFNTGNLGAGLYDVKVTISDGEFTKEILKNDFINVVSGEVDGIGKFNGVDTLIFSGPERKENDPLNKTFNFSGLPANTAYNTVFTGDFDGDGLDTIGIFDPKTGEWYITNNIAGGVFEIRFNKVAPLVNAINVNMIAVAGDFDGDGKDSVGIFVKGMWYISNDLNSSDWEIVESFGIGPNQDGPFKPIVGDWNKDGKDSLGYFSQTLPRIRLSNDSVENTDINSSNVIKIAHSISSSQGALPYAGDFDGDARDDYALRTSAGSFRVWPVGSNANNYYINFGIVGDQIIVGNW